VAAIFRNAEGHNQSKEKCAGGGVFNGGCNPPLQVVTATVQLIRRAEPEIVGPAD
jgi:hypothetical protein